MDAAEFLLPRDRELTPTAILKHFQAANPTIHYDHVLFNNASDLPKRSTSVSSTSIAFLTRR